MASYTQQQSSLEIGGLTDIEGAKSIARKLLESYSKSGSTSELKSDDISPMMVDAYQCMNKPFNPNRSDVDTYFKILDRNGDGKVSLQDLEQLAVKYLAGNVNLQSEVKEQQIISKTQEEGFVQPRMVESVTINKVQNQLQEQPADKQINIEQYQDPQTKSMTVSTTEKKLTEHGSVTKTQTKTVTQTEYKTKTVSQPVQSSQESQIKSQLEVARKLFKRFDTDNTGYITEDEVGPLLTATFKNMGINYTPQDEDIEQWIEMTDTDGDGKVSLEEYEALIIKSLKEAGIIIE